MEELNEEVVEPKKGLTGRNEGKPTILIPGEIESVSKRGVTVAAGTVYDYKQNKFQQDINEDLQQLTDDINQNVKHTLSEHSGEIENINEALEENIPYVIVYENQTVNIPCDTYGGYAGSEEEVGTVVKLYRGNIQLEIEYDNSVHIDSPTDKNFGTEVIEEDGSAIISIPYADISNLDDTTEVDFHILSQGKAYYGKVIFNKVKQGKSAYEEWKDLHPEIENPTPARFIAELKNTNSINGPKYALDTASATEDLTIYFIPNSDPTKFDIWLREDSNTINRIAEGIPGDITNYTSVYDVSADHNDTQYSSLQEAVAAIPSGVGKGGMEIKYKDVDGKYHQYRYMLADLNGFNVETNWEEIDFSASNISLDNSAVGEILSYWLNDRIEVTDLVQGHIKNDGDLNSSTLTRVSTQYINVVDNDLILYVTGNFFIRNANRYTQSSQSVIFPAEMYHGYKLEKGYKYRVTFCKEDRTQNLSPSELEGKVFLIPLPNSSVRQIENKVEDNSNEIASINNLVEDIDGGGETVPLLPFVQGYIKADGTLSDLATRVSTEFIDATESSLILRATGNYRIRNGNRYTAAGINLGQVIRGDYFEEFVLQQGYKYRMSFCHKDDLSANITPAMVAPYVSLEKPSKRQIVVKVNETANKVDALEEQKKNKGNYLINDYFNENNYNPNNYSNFSTANLSSGHYNIAAGWTNTLKMSKVVSFHDFTFEFDVNVTSNTEKIVIATEVTEAVAGSIYGSCAYIDMSAAKMYLLKPKLYNDSNPPNTPGSSTIVAQIALTNVTSQSHRYIVSFGKKDRNLFVKFRNYYTNEIVELTCVDANNTSLAGSGYDMLRVGSMSGAISVNNIVGITKTNVDVLFVGDSITDGRGIALADSWAYKLGSYFTDNFAIAARSGGQIQQVINLLSKWGRYINAKVIIVSIGVNGGNTNEKFLELYNLIIGLNAIPVINTIYNVGDNFNNIGETEWTGTNNYILSLPCKHVRFDIATSLNKYSPIFRQLDANYSLIDTVHPNENGSLLLYERAVTDLKQLELLI